MRLVALLQPAQDRDRVGHGGLTDEHRLEAAFERGVLLDVLAVLVERRRADGAQLTARQHRLEQVAGAHGALGCARTDDRVQLVDEEDDLAGCRLDLVQHRFQPLLELAAVLRACEQRADVERPHALALQPFGDIACDDPLREPLGDRRLADARLADQHRVVLRATGEHLDRASYFLIPTDNRVELAALGERGEVAAVLLECLIRALGILGRDALSAADARERLEQLVARDEVEREQQVLDRDVLVAERAHLVLRLVDRAVERGRRARLLAGARDRRLLPQARLGFGPDRFCVGSRTLDEGARQLLVEQRDRQVVGCQLRVAHPARKLLRARDGLARFQCQLVEVHVSSPGPVDRPRPRGDRSCARRRSGCAAPAPAAPSRSGGAASRPRAGARARHRRG